MYSLSSTLRVLLITACGTSAAFLATRMVQDGYEAQTTIWVERSDANSQQQELLRSEAWIDLFRSRHVLREHAFSRDLTVEMDRHGHFLLAKLRGPEADEVVATLNEIADRYVTVSTELKAEKLGQIAKILEEQLAVSESRLRDAEAAYEKFFAQAKARPEETAEASPDDLAEPSKLAERRRLVENQRELYIALALRHEDALLKAAATIPDVRVLDRPLYALPLGPHFQPIYIIAGAFLLSLLIALWSVWMVYRMEKREEV